MHTVFYILFVTHVHCVQRTLATAENTKLAICVRPFLKRVKLSAELLQRTTKINLGYPRGSENILPLKIFPNATVHQLLGAVNKTRNRMVRNTQRRTRWNGALLSRLNLVNTNSCIVWWTLCELYDCWITTWYGHEPKPKIFSMNIYKQNTILLED